MNHTEKNYQTNDVLSSIANENHQNFGTKNYENINELSGLLVNIFYKVHSTLGPGLLETVYERLICFELKKAGISYLTQKGIPVIYESQRMEMGFRADIIVDNRIIIEIKSIEAIAPVHLKQLQTYLKLSNIKLGLLVNFNTNLVRDGIRRIVNNL